MSFVQKTLVSPSKEDEEEVARDIRNESMIQVEALRNFSVYETFQHPNEE
jgi:hypothetical protein